MEDNKTKPAKFTDDEYARSRVAIAQYRETGRATVR